MAEHNTTPQPGRRFSFVAAPLVLIAALVASLGQDDAAHEGRRYAAYRDSAGILTVCAGVTGSAVVPGKKYSPEECTALETDYVSRMLTHMGKCVTGEFEFHEIKAWGHFAYNIGTERFCSSTAAKRLNQGERKTACSEISRFRFVRIGGQMRDCALPQWQQQCGGIPKRRAWERATCEGRGENA